jgi:16S rRNA (adenine1518-N6/adenine1519-N6)-dimethyltransferase
MNRPPRRVKDTLSDLAINPSKARGQNFLIAPGALAAIVEFGKPRADESLLEIGPGLGALTSELIRVAPLTVIEIEERFCDELENRFEDITIVHADCREVDLSELGDKLTVFGNLPYSFSTDIIMQLIDQRAVVRRAVLLLQKEFVQRLGGAPGTKAYGTLSIAVQLHAQVTLGPVIGGDCFHPPAKVESQVVELSFFNKPKYELKNPYWHQRFVAAAFFRRRKKIANSIQASGSFPGIDIIAMLQAVGLDPEKRAEDFTVGEFVSLSNYLVENFGKNLGLEE